MDILEKLREGVLTNSVEETESLAFAFVSKIPADSFICLNGNLGTGKTAFVRGIAKFLNVSTQVKSPSFNICNIYPEGLVHIDAYRVGDYFDFGNFLIDELARSPSIICVEWAEKIRESIPSNAYNLEFSIINESHFIKLG